MDKTLIGALVLDLNIVKSHGPIVLVKACAAQILGGHIVRLFATHIQLKQNQILLVLPKYYKLRQTDILRVCKLARQVCSLVEISLTLEAGST